MLYFNLKSCLNTPTRVCYLNFYVCLIKSKHNRISFLFQQFTPTFPISIHIPHLERVLCKFRNYEEYLRICLLFCLPYNPSSIRHLPPSPCFSFLLFRQTGQRNRYPQRAFPSFPSLNSPSPSFCPIPSSTFFKSTSCLYLALQTKTNSRQNILFFDRSLFYIPSSHLIYFCVTTGKICIGPFVRNYFFAMYSLTFSFGTISSLNTYAPVFSDLTILITFEYVLPSPDCKGCDYFLCHSKLYLRSVFC